MKSNGKVYRCAVCNTHTGAIHEIIFGRGWREVSVEACIQLPLCQHCHMTAHGQKSCDYPNYLSADFGRKSQKEARSILGKILVVDTERMLYLYRQITGICGKNAKDMIMKGKDKRQKKIKEYEL